MQYRLTHEGAYLRVDMWGAPSETEILAMLRAILAESRARSVQGALVEVRVAYALDLVSTKNLITMIPALGFPPGFRFAALLLDDIPREAASFAEDVAFNRSIGVRVFDDREAALRWLLSP